MPHKPTIDTRSTKFNVYAFSSFISMVAVNFTDIQLTQSPILANN